MQSIYFDHNATTPIDGRVLDAMLPYLQENYGNPSSGHRVGLIARTAINTARAQVAALVNVHPTQVVFTSGGTEANNLALLGLMKGVIKDATAKVQSRKNGALMVSAIEHASVAQAAKAIKKDGGQVHIIGVNEAGQVTKESLNQAIRQCGDVPPAMVSVMYANNETGVRQDIPMIAEQLAGSTTILHTDAAQLAGKARLDFLESGANLITLSAHKIYGPKGIGALIIDKSIDITPILNGGHQEFGRRAGTENVAAIVGFGKAAELAAEELIANQEYLLELRQYLETELMSAIPDVIIYAADAERLPNTLFFAIPGIEGETLLMSLDQQGIAVSSGSACDTASTEPSAVLMAMGVNRTEARGAIRISLGKANGIEEIDYFIKRLKKIITTFKSMASVAAV